MDRSQRMAEQTAITFYKNALVKRSVDSNHGFLRWRPIMRPISNVSMSSNSRRGRVAPHPSPPRICYFGNWLFCVYMRRSLPIITWGVHNNSTDRSTQVLSFGGQYFYYCDFHAVLSDTVGSMVQLPTRVTIFSVKRYLVNAVKHYLIITAIHTSKVRTQKISKPGVY